MNNTTTMLQTGVPIDKATTVGIVVHGRGQSPKIMQEHIVARLQTPNICFLLPAASQNSWYDARAIEPLTAVTRQQLQQSLLGIHAAMTQALSAAKPVVLIGFSQGACLCMEYAFANGGWHGALACLTGCRVGVASDDRPRTDLKGMPVYLSGSDADPWIPVADFAFAAGEFGAAKAKLRCDVLPGRPHEVSDLEIKVLEDILAAQTAAQTNSNQRLWP
jgi:phospholipase/carboxylesterase